MPYLLLLQFKLHIYWNIHLFKGRKVHFVCTEKLPRLSWCWMRFIDGSMNVTVDIEKSQISFARKK